MIVTVVAMIGMVAIDISIHDLTDLFGLCGGWGMTFVSYFVPSLIGFAASKGEPLWYRGLLLLSASAVLVMAVGFTYVTFITSTKAPVGNSTYTTYDDEVVLPSYGGGWGPLHSAF
jgi:hypothetical protein